MSTAKSSNYPDVYETATRYEDMYVRVGVEQLRKLHAEHPEAIESIKSTYIRRGHIVNDRPDRNHAVSISLFRPLEVCRPSGTAPTPAEENDRWDRKYLERLLCNLSEFPKLFDPLKWKVILHTHPASLGDRWHEIMASLSAFDFVEIHVMAHASKGLSPGPLWRFLPISDERLQEVLILDVDEPWKDDLNGWYSGAAPCGMPFTRAHHIPRNGFWLNYHNPWSDPHGRLKCYPSILASKILVRPARFGIPDIDDLIAAYVFLRKSRVAAGFPCSQLSDDEALTPYNASTEHYPYGKGNHWYGHCFDESFLKHVLYYYAAENGALCTYCYPQDVAEDLPAYLLRHQLNDFIADFRHCQESSAGNIIVNGNRPVRLDLTPSRPDTSGHREGTPAANPTRRQIVQFPTDALGISPGVEFHPFRNLVAASFWGTNSIVVYSIDSEGGLHLVQAMEDSVSRLYRPHSILFSPLGTRMWVNNYGSNTINVYKVPLTDGLVEERPLQIFRPPPSLKTEFPHGFAMSSDGAFLACAYCDSEKRGNKLVLYQVSHEPDQIHLDVVSVVEAADIGWPNTKGICFTPDDQCLAVTMSPTNTLMLFDIDLVSGRIDPEPLQTLRNPEARLSRPEEAKFSPDGRFCAVSNSTADTVTFYEYDRNKRVFASSKPAFSIENPEAGFHFPHGIAFSPDGRSLAISDYGFFEDDAKWKFNLRRKGKLQIIDLYA